MFRKHRAATLVAGNTRIPIAWPRWAVVAALLLAASPRASLADEIYLKNGHKITGSIVREDSRQVVYDQAENRLHVQRAVMALTMG